MEGMSQRDYDRSMNLYNQVIKSFSEHLASELGICDPERVEVYIREHEQLYKDITGQLIGVEGGSADCHLGKTGDHDIDGHNGRTAYLLERILKQMPIKRYVALRNNIDNILERHGGPDMDNMQNPEDMEIINIAEDKIRRLRNPRAYLADEFAKKDINELMRKIDEAMRAEEYEKIDGYKSEIERLNEIKVDNENEFTL